MGVEAGSITKVMRPSDDLRVSSTGANGPSLNHSRRIGRLRGSHINDPHPRQAIFIFLSFLMSCPLNSMRLCFPVFVFAEGSKQGIDFSAAALNNGREIGTLGDAHADSLNHNINDF